MGQLARSVASEDFSTSFWPVQEEPPHGLPALLSVLPPRGRMKTERGLSNLASRDPDPGQGPMGEEDSPLVGVGTILPSPGASGKPRDNLRFVFTPAVSGVGAQCSAH